ncbi:MAG: hypothetical protein ABJB74_13285 [Gemmatimonas sp.]
MLRSIAAVLAGFLVMSAVVMIGTVALTALLVPGGIASMKVGMKTPGASMPTPSTTYLAANLVLSLVAAISGGLVTQRIAASAPDGHLVALGAVMLVMSVVSAFSPGSAQQPEWVKFVIPVIALVGIAASRIF